jgi:hypothetical protein
MKTIVQSLLGLLGFSSVAEINTKINLRIPVKGERIVPEPFPVKIQKGHVLTMAAKANHHQILPKAATVHLDMPKAVTPYRVRRSSVIASFGGSSRDRQFAT